MSNECISYLCGEITTETAHALMGDLKGHKVSGAKKVRLIINSTGGNVADGLHIRKTIAELGIPVHAEVIGTCSSIAFVILQACTTRRAVPGATFTLHFMSYGSTTMMLYADELGIEITKANAEKRWRALQEEIILYSRFRSDLTRSEILGIMLSSNPFGTKWAFAVGMIDDILVGRSSKMAA